MSRVLVTGGSGFIGSHCILQLLANGHEVHTTVRSLKREDDVRAMLKQGGYEGSGGRLTFFAADLENDSGWPQAVAGCDYVLHVASPFPLAVPKREDDLVRPARDGALRVLRAARDAGVKRVVLTSSFAAIGYGHKERPAPFDETDWTNLGGTAVLPTRSRRRWPSARRGTSSPGKGVAWNSRWSIRWRCSGRCWAPTIPRRSCW